MPNYKDYELLNESLRYMGDSFSRQRQNNRENSNRVRALDTADRRTEIEDRHYKDATATADERNRITDQRDTAATALANRRMDEGQTEAWLTGEDGGTIMYRGNPQGLQTLQEQAAARGKPLKMTDKPQNKPKIGSFRTQTPLGELTLNVDTPNDVPSVVDLITKLGGKAKEQGSFNTAPSYNTEYQTRLESAVANAATPEEAAAAQRKLEIFKSQRTNPGDSETVTERYPAVTEAPEIPGQPAHGIGPWRKPATPPIPAQAAAPERTVTRRVPVGGSIAPPPAAAPAAGGKVRVINPAGQVGSIPAGQVPAALQQGYKLAK